ncbi:MAG: histidine phosphatase family protein [Candidatus Sericytochromatia bacterium]|nr:histidine phosphatase family protein [Candidatus Tanganyikabacteria bacterium]
MTTTGPAFGTVRPLRVLRHARVKVARGICYGLQDVPFSRTHTAQVAAAFVDALDGRVPARARISPRTRCLALWQAVAGQLRRDEAGHAPDGSRIAVSIDSRIGEMDFGAWEGLAWGHIPEAQMTGWTDRFLDYPCGGGESVRRFLSRMLEAWQEDAESPAGIIWVAHAGILRGLEVLEANGWKVPDQLAASDWPRRSLDFGAWEDYPLGIGIGARA